MADRNFARSVASMRLLTELGARHGLSASACLAGTGVREGDLADPAGVVSAAQELQLIRNLVARRGGVPALGIEGGTRYHFTAYGMLGFAMASSPTLRSALDIALRFSALTFAFTRFRVEDAAGETRITLDDLGVAPELRRFILERDASALATVQRDLSGARPALNALHFSFPAPKNIAPYEAAFGVRPVFGAAATVAAISSEALRQPLPQANELMLKTAEDQCLALLDRRRARAGLAARVRDRLVRNSAAMPDMEAIAETLCLTARTLRRRLAAEGTTFIDLRDEVRLALAEDYLLRPNLAVEEIAAQLGYATPTSFINAFKRWKGVTPLGYRKRIRAAQAV